MTFQIDTILNIDPDIAVGSMLPTVYIDQVTLETINTPDPPGKERIAPHISVEERKNLSLKTTLKLILKDQMKGNFSEWFKLPDQMSQYKNLIKVAIVQTTKPSASNLWGQVKIAPDLKWKNDQKLRQMAFDGTTILTFGLNELNGTQKSKDIKKKWFEVSLSGNKIYNFVKYISFPASQKIQGNDQKIYLSNEQAHLSYYVYSYIESDQPNIPLAIGKVNSDVVLKNGQTPLEAYIYTNSRTGDIWTGPVHYLNGDIKIGGQPYVGFMGGEVHETDSPLLSRTIVPNNAVIDYRLLNYVKEVPLNLSILKEKTLKDTLGVIQNISGFSKPFDSSVITRKYATFSPSYLSRDSYGNCRFMFTVDMKVLVRENSSFGKLFANHQFLFEQYLKFIKIKSFKVYRKRVNSTESDTIKKAPNKFLFSPKTKAGKFNIGGIANLGDMFEKEIPAIGIGKKKFKKKYSYDRTREVIIESSQKDGTLKGNLSLGDGESLISEMPSIYLETPKQLNGLFYYMVVDRSIKKLGSGNFQYEIEIALEDNLSDFVLSQKNLLINDVKQLSQILKFADLKDFNELTDDTNAREAKSETFVNNRYYDPILEKFTNQFIKDCSSGKILKEVDPNFWQSIPSRYLASLQMFADISISSEKNEALKQFMLKTKSSCKQHSHWLF